MSENRLYMIAKEIDRLRDEIASLREEIIKFILRGESPKIEVGLTESRMVVVRFLTDTEAFVGGDMKVYGPFKREDVALIPAENAKILIRKGLAVEVETR